MATARYDAEPVQRDAAAMSDVERATSSTQTQSGESLITSASWMTGGNLLSQVFAYGSAVLLAPWLSPSNFGTVAVGTAIVYIAVLFVDQGVWGAVVVERKLTRADLG